MSLRKCDILLQRVVSDSFDLPQVKPINLNELQIPPCFLLLLFFCTLLPPPFFLFPFQDLFSSSRHPSWHNTRSHFLPFTCAHTKRTNSATGKERKRSETQQDGKRGWEEGQRGGGGGVCSWRVLGVNYSSNAVTPGGNRPLRESPVKARKRERESQSCLGRY